jgi:hypothetical protein
VLRKGKIVNPEALDSAQHELVSILVVTDQGSSMPTTCTAFATYLQLHSLTYLSFEPAANADTGLAPKHLSHQKKPLLMERRKMSSMLQQKGDSAPGQC